LIFRKVIVCLIAYFKAIFREKFNKIQNLIKTKFNKIQATETPETSENFNFIKKFPLKIFIIQIFVWKLFWIYHFSSNFSIKSIIINLIFYISSHALKILKGIGFHQVFFESILLDIKEITLIRPYFKRMKWYTWL